jgi:ABC-type branched-subunit amino acid transport system ATPase component
MVLWGFTTAVLEELHQLAIGRALLTNPSVLLMDEPTEGLAPVIVEALTAVLARLREEAALAIVPPSGPNFSPDALRAS